MSKKTSKASKNVSPEQAAYNEANDAYQAAWRAEVKVAEEFRRAERGFLAIPRSGLVGRWQSLKQVFLGHGDLRVEHYFAERARLADAQALTQATLHVREQMYRIIAAPRD